MSPDDTLKARMVYKDGTRSRLVWYDGVFN